MKTSKEHRQWMSRALRLARRGWGQTSPNPMVGALLVCNGQVIGRGWHHRAGEDHAEILALRDAGCVDRLPTGTVLYVTLEPCSSHGRTPPCTDSIIKARPAAVVIGCEDPNPRHAGRGVDILRNAGIELILGVEEERCRRLNEAFNQWICHGRPFVLLKLAMTLDGRIATADGNSQWITGDKARQRVHRLRQWADAIMIGGETARLDRPSLTVRNCGVNWQQPRRLVWTRKLNRESLIGIMGEGAEAETISASSREQWLRELSRLGSEGVTALLLEGGGELAASVLAAAVVDRVELHYAPKLLGGRGSRPAIAGADPKSLDSAIKLRMLERTALGEDFMITGIPCFPDDELVHSNKLR